MASSLGLRTLCSNVSVAIKTTRWEKLKSSKAGVWCRGLLTDYKEACKEAVVGAWERPFKASVYLSLLGGAWACSYTNPDDTSFENTLLEQSNQLGLLSPWIRNRDSDGSIQNLVKLHNQGRLRHISLGVVSLIYCADYAEDANLFEAQCSNLSVLWRELHRQVLDIGFAGRWWILHSKMKDYDVNEEEFRHLPAAMVTTTPPSVKVVETNERLHKESWLPLNVEESIEKEAGGQSEQSMAGYESAESEEHKPAGSLTEA
ncbi:mitochondrial import inner membrane translocase subunit Tim29 [Aplochiton taeniatus]